MIRVKNAPFLNVVASSKATLSLPLGPTYHGILLKLGGTFTKAMINRLVVRLNQKPVVDLSGTQLDLMNTYKGGAIDASFLLVDFTQHQAKDIASEMFGSIPTAAGINTFTVEVDIGAATSPTLESWSLISGALPDVLQTNIYTATPIQLSYSGAGTWDAEIPHGPGSAHEGLMRCWLFGGNITGVLAKKNGLDIYDSTRTDNEFLAAHYEGTNNSAFYCVDFVMANNTIPEMIRTTDAQDFRLKITTSGASTPILIVESVANLGRL